MAVSVIEYGGAQSGRPYAANAPQLPPLQVTQYSSATTSTGFLLPATKYVEIFTTSGVNAWALFTGTTSSTIALSTATSTNAIPIPPGVLVGFYVQSNPFAVNSPLIAGTTVAQSTSGFRYSILSS